MCANISVGHGEAAGFHEGLWQHAPGAPQSLATIARIQSSAVMFTLPILGMLCDGKVKGVAMSSGDD